ncbi:MAG: response regulator [Candidatus Marinimicrobia bacterium]|jgi:DNA-binding response OmpR family regulator|nr:response regulator [Candidatus Neomarinimicrobiota bacterium]MBT3576480.1 response regulator [Candidatus Neomarinimicrobiota bacterium]MBT3681266.1 response regulator [Candidatus Neomarinimicrobiota bacterium]MBT4130849.1 response regulator [Candidatus Neomarinimicrobiota bacterium]MBT4295874.1 response regulator [Candidatus Neomarinimicrobiota bacterium]
MSNILVIEDEASMGEFMVTMLEMEGYHVDLAPDGIEGLNLYNREHHDLVITDMIMPRKEGFEVCMELLKFHPAPEIIAMSAGYPEYLKFVSALGVKYTFEKPFDVAEFLRSVSKALSGNRKNLN